MLVQLFHDSGGIGHDAQIGHLKDGGTLIGIDSYHEFGIFHTGQVLDSTADTEGQIGLGADGGTGLAHLTGMLQHTGIYQSAGGGHGAAQVLRQRKSGSHILDTTAAGYQQLGIGDFSTDWTSGTSSVTVTANLLLSQLI